MYNKLFTKILDSTIWLESNETRLVWITFIAAMDETGFVPLASAGNVAGRARVTLEEAEAALKILEAPDLKAPGQEHDGRRIERTEGGWVVLNAEKYREMVTRVMIQEQTRRRVAEFRKKRRATPSNAPVTPSNAPVTQSVAVAETIPSADAGRTGVGTVHQVFIKGWTDNFAAFWHATYIFDGGKDGSAVKALLKRGILPIDLLELAKRAWAAHKANPFLFACKQAVTIAGFASQLNRIQLELKQPNENHRQPASRNDGTYNDKPLTAAALSKVR